MSGRLSDNFGEFDGRLWLNTAHQGALPLSAAAAAAETINWKISPYHMKTTRFREVPTRMRTLLGQLIGAPAEEILLANSASFGLHMIANCYPWQAGDEILVLATDFPSDILPWLTLERRFGVKVRQLTPNGQVLTAAEVEAALTPRTRLYCATWVHSFSGAAINVKAVGEVCRQAGVHFILNGSQAVGYRSVPEILDSVDALISVGFKWLCGPYGTGFFWLSETLYNKLSPIQSYWLAQQTQEELAGAVHEQSVAPKSRRDFEIFGTANFFNFVPWAASVEHVLELGIENVAQHDQSLVAHFIAGLDDDRYKLLSPRDGPERSNLVFFSHRDPAKNASLVERLTAAKIDVAARNSAIRLAPHIYNAVEDINRVLAVLDEADV